MMKRFIENNWILVVVLALHLAFFAFYYTSIFEDDIYISIRYADNLYNGRGLVYNSGERFEGYSNFLFILFAALLHAVIKNYFLIAKALSIIFLFGFLVVFYVFAKKYFSKKWLFGLLMLTVAIDPVFIAAGSLALETSMYLFFTFAAFAAFVENWKIGRFKTWSLLALLSVLTRPEGILFVFILVLAELLSIFDGVGREKIILYLKRLFSADKLFVYSGALIYTLWRYLYYGSLLTGPALFKSANSNYFVDFAGLLIDKTKAFTLFHIYYFIPLVFALYFIIRNFKNPAFKFPSLFMVLYYLFDMTLHGVIFTDYANFWRYHGQIIPFVLFVGFLGIERALGGHENERLFRLIGPAAIIGLVLLFILTPYKDIRFHQQVARFDQRNLYYAAAGNFIRNLKCDKNNFLLSTHEAGIVPFLSGLRTLDWWLNDRTAAELIYQKNKEGWRDYIISKKPDLFFVAGQSWSRKLLEEFFNKNYVVIWENNWENIEGQLQILKAKEINCVSAQ